MKVMMERKYFWRHFSEIISGALTSEFSEITQKTKLDLDYRFFEDQHDERGGYQKYNSRAEMYVKLRRRLGDRRKGSSYWLYDVI